MRRVLLGLVSVLAAIGVHVGAPMQAHAADATSLTVSSTPQIGVWGTQFSLIASAQCNGVAFTSAPVEVLRRTIGQGDTLTIANGFTDAAGTFAIIDQPPASSEYSIMTPGSGSCSSAAALATVWVRPSVALNVSQSTVGAGSLARFSGRVLPPHPGQVVILQTYRADLGAWVFHSFARLNSASEFSAAYRKNRPGMLIFRVIYPTQHRDHAWNISRRVRVDWVQSALPPTPTPSQSCHSSYRGACLRPDASDYDCVNGGGNGPYYTGEVQVVGPDVYDLDRDGDGIGCEGQ